MAKAKTAKTTRGKKMQVMDASARLGAKELVEDFDAFAEHIEGFADSIRILMTQSRLSKRALLVLIHDTLPQHKTKSGKIMGIKDLEKFMDHLQVLDDYLLKGEDED